MRHTLLRPMAVAAAGHDGAARLTSRTGTLAPYALRVDVTHASRPGTVTPAGHGQARAPATGTAALVRALASGEAGQPGAWMPEQVITPSRYFERLVRAGLHVQAITSAGQPAAR